MAFLATEEERMVFEVPFFNGSPSLRIQSVLYGNALQNVDMALASAARAAALAVAAGELSYVEVAFGDSSSEPVIDSGALCRLRQRYLEFSRIDYSFFNSNFGSARGHNTLLRAGATQFILIMNPDVRLAPSALLELLRPFRRVGVGMTEARQLPVEHPKAFDRITGETSWATTACALIPRPVATAVNGFDAESFFLYCDDVDFSWRIRLLGLKVIYQPSAVAFHDKRLSDKGQWQAGPAEMYYSAEAALMMAWKWSRPELVELYLASFANSDQDHLRRAAAEFERRRQTGALPKPLDPAHKVAQFVGNNYTEHRFPL
jgi:GT2 family glycosyltransferase